MPKRLTAMRLSTFTEQQLDTLASRFGMNKTEVIQMAIDRLYQAEIGGQDTKSAQQAQSVQQAVQQEASDGK
jgi:predicted DNA-binding protein